MFIIIVKHNLGKFCASSNEGIFVGNSIRSKTYRVYDKSAKNIEENIHVIFDEFNDGELSDSIGQDLNKNNHSDDEDKRCYV